MENAIDNIPQMWSVLESAPYTLVHNDCNPRNICLRKPDAPMIQKFSPTNPAKQEGSTFTPYSSDFTMCMYDWELATIGVPQHDLVEFLAFSVQPNASLQTRLEFIDFYRQHLQHYSGMEFPNERYMYIRRDDRAGCTCNCSSTVACSLHRRILSWSTVVLHM